MRPYHEYAPDQAFLLPASLKEAIQPHDPVFVVREAVGRLDLGLIHRALASERGRPPFHPQAMVGLLLYGACKGVYSSRKLQLACSHDISFMYLMASARPDFRTIAVFRKRFRKELRGLFRQVLEMCRQAGLIRLGHVSLDGTKVRANASKHKAMSYERLLAKRKLLEAEIEGWFKQAEAADSEEDAEHGSDDDGFSLPADWRETAKRLAKIAAAQALLEEKARQRAEREGLDPDVAVVGPKAQTNFTDPDSRIMHTPDGFQQAYNAQAAVDTESQVIVAEEVSQAPPDVQRLVPMLEQIIALNGQAPSVLTAAEVHAVIALRRYHRDEPPDADPAQPRATNRWPYRNQMRERLFSPEGKALYKLRKQTVEPVFGQIKAARGLRQFLCRGLEAVQAEWSLACTAHNLLKLAQVGLPA
jgi:transposase